MYRHPLAAAARASVLPMIFLAMARPPSAAVSASSMIAYRVTTFTLCPVRLRPPSGDGQQPDLRPDRGPQHRAPPPINSVQPLPEFSGPVLSLRATSRMTARTMPASTFSTTSARAQSSISATCLITRSTSRCHFNLNYEPIGTGWPFTPSNLSPITTGSTQRRHRLPVRTQPLSRPRQRHWLVLVRSYQLQRPELHPEPPRLARSGVGSELHVLQVHGPAQRYRRRHGPEWPSDQSSWNYGRQSSDRTHNLPCTYNYDIPGLGQDSGRQGSRHCHRSLGTLRHHRASRAARRSTSVAASFRFASQTGGYTGTGDISSRCNVIGNPYSNIGTNGNGQVYFNAAA